MKALILCVALTALLSGLSLWAGEHYIGPRGPENMLGLLGFLYNLPGRYASLLIRFGKGRENLVVVVFTGLVYGLVLWRVSRFLGRMCQRRWPRARADRSE
jgi:hypothetical protein